MVKSTPKAKSLEVHRLPLARVDWMDSGIGQPTVSPRVCKYLEAASEFCSSTYVHLEYWLITSIQAVSTNHQRGHLHLRLTWVQDSCRAAPRSTISGVVWSLVSLRRPCLYSKTSALIYCFIVFPLSCSGVHDKIPRVKTQHLQILSLLWRSDLKWNINTEKCMMNGWKVEQKNDFTSL